MRKAFTAFVIGMQLLTMRTVSAETNVNYQGCRLTSSNDTSGQIIQDPNTQTGTIDAGPVTIVPEPGETIFYVTLTCIVQINDATNPGTSSGDICCEWVDGVWVCHPCPPLDHDGVWRSSTTSGNVGVLADTITYSAAPGDDVYVCMIISWHGSNGDSEVAVDADDSTSGTQCSLTTSVEA